MKTDGEWAELAQYSEFSPQIEVYCSRILNDPERARDMVQEVFIRFMQGRQGNGDNTRAWLYRVARNLCIDHLRRDARFVSLDDTEILYARGGDDPATQAVQTEERERMIENMQKLPPRQQEVLRLKFQENMTYTQIAEVTGDTVTTVGWLLHEALKSMRSKMAATP